MYRLWLILLATLLVFGCARTKKRSEDTAAYGDAFNPNMADEAALSGNELGGRSPYDIPQPTGSGRFFEPGSGMIDPAIDAEARMVLRDIHFAYDSAQILPNEAAILQQIAAFLKRYPQVILQIEGHCDERGTEEYNMALGSRRANSTRQFLADLGIDPNRLYTISYGEMRPVDPGHSEAAWAKNRRCHFLIGIAGQ